MKAIDIYIKGTRKIITLQNDLHLLSLLLNSRSLAHHLSTSSLLSFTFSSTPLQPYIKNY